MPARVRRGQGRTSKTAHVIDQHPSTSPLQASQKTFRDATLRPLPLVNISFEAVLSRFEYHGWMLVSVSLVRIQLICLLRNFLYLFRPLYFYVLRAWKCKIGGSFIEIRAAPPRLVASTTDSIAPFPTGLISALIVLFFFCLPS